MADLKDGERTEVAGSGSARYELKNTGGVYSCSCPAWRNQSLGIERRTCKHLRAFRGEEAEAARVGSALPPPRGAPSDAAGEEGVPGKTAPPLLLAENWESDADLSGWWMSEKLDGVRAYWNGKEFVSRLGNLYLAPEWFREGLPDFPLDGELWLGRKRFQQTVSVVRRQDRSDHWKEIRFVVFDAPAMEGPFEERLRFFHDLIERRRPPHAAAHPHEACRDLAHLKAELARVEAQGGEGLMLRRPGSRYEVGRSSTLLKVKNFFDAEARVLGHLEGAGRHKGRLGALQVELPDGTRFSIGTGLSDREREAPLPVGTVVAFRYQELSDKGVPRFPSYAGVAAPAPTAPAKGPPGPAASTGSSSRSAVSGAEEHVDKKAASPPPPAPEPPAEDGEGSAEGTAAPSSAETPAGGRRFELSDGKSNKFWEIAVAGREVTVRFGRIGTKGQAKPKAFADEAAAGRAAAGLVAEKTAKGYVEKK